MLEAFLFYIPLSKIDAMIIGKQIGKSYGDLKVLKGVDVHITKGEVVSIVGASGAGKSTLLHILGTLDRMDNGLLTINEVAISSLNDKQLAQFRNQNIGFVFQFHHLLPEFTAVENVCIPAFIAKSSESAARTRAKELLSMLGLEHRFSHKPSQLSGGEQQRIAVARALINNPAIVLADEPSGNLDSNSAQQLHELFFQLRDELNQTIVIVTHNNQLAEMADRKLVMTDGIIGK